MKRVRENKNLEGYEGFKGSTMLDYNRSLVWSSYRFNQTVNHFSVKWFPIRNPMQSANITNQNESNGI